LKGIENLINLIELYCYDNQLTSLEGIENLVNFEKLYCNDNQLTSLKEMENLINLEYLDCYNNKLTSLEGIKNLVDLKELYCDNNKLTSLEGIENLVKLIKNKNNILNFIKINFIDSDDYIELNILFNNLIECKNNHKICEYIEEIEKMITELNGRFQIYVLK
jgi:Leucine-rich repeat (LRR) protein